MNARTLGLLLLCSGASAAAEERFIIQPSGAGPQRLEVPPAFLSASASGDLADLRLRSGSGEEVPYLLVPPPSEPPRWTTASRIRAIPSTKTESGAELDLGAVRTVAGLELTFPGSGFLKRARVEGSGDGLRWTVLSEQAVFYALPLDPGACGGAVCPGSLVRKDVRFEPADVRLLRVVMDDRRSPRVQLPTTARALLARQDAPAPGPSVPLAVTRREGEPGTSRFSLRLPGPHLPVRAVVLEVDASRLARPARVLEARLAGGRLAPETLGSGALLVVERDGVLASELRIPISAPEELELELVVEDGDNPPLPLTAARAELAPLPWVFLESSDGSAIEARLGDRERRAPHYDLEALRPELASLRPRRATFSGPPAAPAPAEDPAPSSVDGAGAGAPVARKDFRRARPIPASPPGLVALRLDADVLARSPTLADLRVVGADGRQIPYLLEQRDEPLVVPLAEEALSEPPKPLARKGQTVHALQAPQPAFPQGRLALETATRVFAREVRVYVEPERPGKHGKLGPELIASASWSHADPGRPAPPLTIPLPDLRARRLLITVDDGDNAPLALSAPRLLLPAYRLRFFHPGPALELLHGAEHLAAPRYDLALLAPRLRAAPAREVALTPPATQGEDPSGPGSGASRIAFWAALGVAVAGLLALLARLVARGGGAPKA